MTHSSKQKSNKSLLTQTGRCELCDEILSMRMSRFQKIYGDIVPTRIIAREHGFVVMPTLGQLFKGSLLILPVQHCETIAELPPATIESAIKLIGQWENKLLPFGNPVIFEHGAKCSTGQGCGIYHAHIHLVPVPGKVSSFDLLPDKARKAPSLLAAWQELRESNHYLLFRDTDGKTMFFEPPMAPPDTFSSQYFRRQLAQHFDLKTAWDWRAYDYLEPWVLETLEWFGVKTVPAETSHRNNLIF
jgi:diadenosine tetraphosphate (Ap4A) HIT family hydrolase